MFLKVFFIVHEHDILDGALNIKNVINISFVVINENDLYKFAQYAIFRLIKSKNIIVFIF